MQVSGVETPKLGRGQRSGQGLWLCPTTTWWSTLWAGFSQVLDCGSIAREHAAGPLQSCARRWEEEKELSVARLNRAGGSRWRAYETHVLLVAVVTTLFHRADGGQSSIDLAPPPLSGPFHLRFLTKVKTECLAM
jgi:hypothetical protein